jgi:hypothetical protein
VLLSPNGEGLEGGGGGGSAVRLWRHGSFGGGFDWEWGRGGLVVAALEEGSFLPWIVSLWSQRRATLGDDSKESIGERVLTPCETKTSLAR